MKPLYDVSDAEDDVLEMLWTFPEGIKQSALLECMNQAGKDWKRQTLNTLITRLMEKGLVERENRHVWAAMTKEEYARAQISKVIEEMYEGKLSKMVLAFTRNQGITKEDAADLQQLLETYKNGVK